METEESVALTIIKLGYQYGKLNLVQKDQRQPLK